MSTATDRSGLGFWNNSETYSKVTGLPVISSIRIITSEVIKQKLSTNKRIKVLSLGIGSGALYSQFFREEIESGTIELYGIDILEDMVSLCKKDLGEKPCLKVGKVEEFSSYFNKTYDVIEAGLVLHHVLRYSELDNIISSCRKPLLEDGYFVLGDIDAYCGEYIEEKLNSLELENGKLGVDVATGDFHNPCLRIPIIDPAYKEDKTILDNLNKTTCNPLLEEVMNLESELKNKLLPLIKQNIDSANLGLEWHREIYSATGWCNLFKKYFKEIEVIDSNQIKERFTEVKDNPFVMIGKQTSNDNTP